jgi:DNA-binding NarL/FixJ family response regulator
MSQTTDRMPRILIVEDDAMVAWDMSISLEEHGFAVCGIAADGIGALAQVDHAAPDIVLMDVNLKGAIDGIETVRILKARRPDLAIIFVTGFGDPDTAARIGALAPAGYLLKPVDPQELADEINRVLKTNFR